MNAKYYATGNLSEESQILRITIFRYSIGLGICSDNRYSIDRMCEPSFRSLAAVSAIHQLSRCAYSPSIDRFELEYMS